MTPFLLGLGLFLVACALGAWAVRGAVDDAQLPLLALQCLLGGIVILGAFVASAEAGRMIARTLGLIGIVLASAVLVAGFVAMERAIARRNDQ